MGKDIAGTKNRLLLIKTYERDIAKIKTSILEREVKILELQETIERFHDDNAMDQRKIKELEANMNQQNDLIGKESGDSEKTEIIADDKKEV